MEHLTKQQIVLLTLLVSFVTSLSTGIVTVSLMDQAPAGVTSTINQVIEKTIMAPQTASVGTVSISVDDQIARAVGEVASSTVKIQLANSNATVGFGLIVNKDGFIVTDSSLVAYGQSYVAVLNDGTVVPVTTSLLYPNQTSQNNSYVYLTPSTNLISGTPIVFTPIETVSSYALGQKVFSFSGAQTFSLNEGLVNGIASTSISTSIASSSYVPGSPLFDIQGNVIGVAASSTTSQGGEVFYPIAPILSIQK